MGYAAPLFDQHPEEQQAKKLSELLGEIQGVLQRTFRDKYWITAEVSTVSPNRSGHYYFELVETDQGVQKASVRANLWAGIASKVMPKFRSVTGGDIQKGMELLMLVSVSMHPQYGLSLVIHDINPEYTLGNLERLRQETISMLQAEGIWNKNKEVPLPTLVQRVAVISSETAAGWGDFHRQIAQSSVGGLLHLELFPSVMQGSETTNSIYQAMYDIHRSLTSFDAIVIIRGGGSKMDLSAFDNHKVCRYIAHNPLPIITGIGHERDLSVADMVAHTSLKTPTAVAEFLLRRMEQVVVQHFAAEDRVTEVLDQLMIDQKKHIEQLYTRSSLFLSHMEKSSLLNIRGYEHRLSQSLQLRMSKEGNRVDNYAYWVNSIVDSQRCKIHDRHQKIDYYLDRLSRWLTTLQDRLTNKLNQYEQVARLQDPANIMKKGYLPVMVNQKPVTRTTQISDGDQLRILLLDGEATVQVQSIKSDTL